MKKIFYSFVVAALFIFHFSCERVKKSEVQPTTAPQEQGGSETAVKQETTPENPTNPSVSMANVVLYPSGKASVTLNVEVARTPEERSQGLQGRESLAAGQGMWFVFDGDVRDPFWMKDTSIPLDIIFVGSDYKIADVIENTTPNSETLLVPRSQYRYALEVSAGSVRETGVVVGDRAEFRLGPP